MDHHLQLRHIGLHRPTRHCARAIAEVMVSLDPPMTALAQATCPDCVDPCCRRATLWYDLADLLAIGFLGLPWPPGQPMRSVGAPCRYLGPGGCRLARLHRPWICTWYLCPRQRSMLNSDLRSEAAAVTSRLAAMKTLRVRLVETFIEASGRA
ncbi:MAG: hypothetical protein QNJ22_05755 [Desulfosarcinaceae bacterium]|nr:hypothetical protein [Desulfosarcinaceae bacterium]